MDQSVVAISFAGWNLWFLGYSDRALERVQEVVGLARTLNHPFSVTAALFYESVIHWLRRNPMAQRVRAEEAVALSESQGFPLYLGVARAIRGAAPRGAGENTTAVANVQEGLALATETGTQSGAPVLLGLLAEVHHAVGRQAEALVAVEMGLALSAQTGQPLFDAELYRLKGKLLLAATMSTATEAERLLRHAMEIARGQTAKALELRAATSLARLLRHQGKRTEAHALLTPLYAWFTEGFTTRDLLDAKALLEELA